MRTTTGLFIVLAATAGLLACSVEPGIDKPDLPAPTTDEESGDEDPSESVGDEDEEEEIFIPVGNDMSAPSCDPWAQDCAEGQKCVPYSSTGGGVWDSNKCVAITGDGQVGDSCSYDGIAAGSDSCGADSHCWDVIEVDGALAGVCTPFCTGSADDPVCGPDTSCLMANEGSINLCITTCDPLLQECSDGLACFWANDNFNCIFTTDESPEGEPCGYINDCAPGNYCAPAEALPACNDAACCAGFCDLDDPLCAIEGTECAPFFEEGIAAPGYENVGICIVPGV